MLVTAGHVVAEAVGLKGDVERLDLVEAVDRRRQVAQVVVDRLEDPEAGELGGDDHRRRRRVGGGGGPVVAADAVGDDLGRRVGGEDEDLLEVDGDDRPGLDARRS